MKHIYHPEVLLAALHPSNQLRIYLSIYVASKGNNAYYIVRSLVPASRVGLQTANLPCGTFDAVQSDLANTALEYYS
jgi:hypothetical protein